MHATATTSISVMPPLQPVLQAHEITQSEFAAGVGLSAAAACRLVKHGLLPARKSAEVRKRAVDFFKARGVSIAHLRDLVLPKAAPRKEVGPAELHLGEAAPESPEPTEPQEEESMLLRNEKITPAAKRHFQLPRSPFEDDIQTRADVYTTANGRYVSRVMLDAAMNHSFVAILGESGSGKSTLRDDLEERIHEERRPIIVIKPYPRVPKKSGGKPMQPSQIETAIFRTLAPGMSRKSDPDERSSQIHELLKSSRAAGFSHLLVIEEAHRMPVDTLKQLKNFMEMRDRLRRLIGVCLIGQTKEMRVLLNERDPEVREIVQRCEQIEMEPLDNDLQGYLEHKFARVSMKLSDVFEADAMDAIRARLINKDALSICYPLVVNNLVSRALNAATQVGFPKIDAQVIAGC